MTETPVLWQSRVVGHSRVDPRTLIAHADNWRAHPRVQREALTGILDDLGLYKSVTVNRNTGVIVDGHLRVATYIEHEQPEIDVEWVDLTPEEEALALASGDAITGWATVKPDKLEKILRSITFGGEATQRFLQQFGKQNKLFIEPKEPAADAGPQLDKAEQLRIKWQTAKNQVWTFPSMAKFGVEHRLIIGDSTDPAVVRRLMQGERVDLIFTDPPYGVDYVGKTPDALKIQNDNLGITGTRALVGDALKAIPLKQGGVYYICAPAAELETAFRLALADVGLTLRQSLVWVKQHFVMSRQDYHWRHESILYGWADGAAHYFLPDRTQDTIILDEMADPADLSKKELIDLVKELRRAERSDVWQEDRPMASLLHPTTKPLALVNKALLNSSRPGEVVFDGFVGSGTTLIGCEQHGRVARVIEKEPKYAAATIERAQLLGLNPHLEDA